MEMMRFGEENLGGPPRRQQGVHRKASVLGSKEATQSNCIQEHMEEGMDCIFRENIPPQWTSQNSRPVHRFTSTNLKTKRKGPPQKTPASRICADIFEAGLQGVKGETNLDYEQSGQCMAMPYLQVSQKVCNAHHQSHHHRKGHRL